MKKLLVIITICLPISCYSQVWSDDFVGIDSMWNISGSQPKVYVMYNFNDSILYIGGGFNYVNNIIINGIMSWNGVNFFGYQNGVTIAPPRAVIIYNDTLYMGGSFDSAGDIPNSRYLVFWNGSSWQRPSIGQCGNYVYDMIQYHDTLFFVGGFSSIGYQSFGRVAAYRNGSWINVGTIETNYVQSLEIFNGELYIGGDMGVQRYVGGTEWEPFPVNPDGLTNELLADSINSFLYVGGQFASVGGQTSVAVAMWDGFSWNSMGSYCGATVWPKAMEIYRGDLYTGCGMIYNSDVYLQFLTRWNGVSWDSIGGAFNGPIFALKVFRDTLYVGGMFSYYGGDSPIPDKRSKGLVKLFMPDNGCDYLKPRINTWADTFYIYNGEAEVNLYNNNPYADSWEWDFGDSQTDDVKDPVHTYTDPGEYNVQVMVTQDGCVKTANKTIYIELGNRVPQFEQIAMQIFPNPSSNGFTVKTSLASYQNAEIIIAGLNGHLQSKIPITGETTDISTKGWKPGVYICNLFIKGKLLKTEKLVFK